MRTKHLLKPHHGIRATPDATEEQVLATLMSMLPSQAFLIGTTAARLWHLPLSKQLFQTALTRPMIGMPVDSNPIRHKAVTGRRLVIQENELELLRGLPLTNPERTWLVVSAQIHLEELVAMTDVLLGPSFSGTTAETVMQISARYPRAPGAGNRRLALDLADPHAESPMESIVRARLVSAGLPRPECNPTIVLPNGAVVRPDMVWWNYMFILEYNGNYHHTPEQARLDEIRRQMLVDIGFRVMLINSDDIWPRDRLVERIRAALGTNADVSAPGRDS